MAKLLVSINYHPTQYSARRQRLIEIIGSEPIDETSQSETDDLLFSIAPEAATAVEIKLSRLDFVQRIQATEEALDNPR